MQNNKCCYMRLKIGKFLKHLIFSRTRERKSPFLMKRLFEAFKTFSEFQLYTSKKLYARDRIVVKQLVFLVCHIVEQCKGGHLVVDLVIGTEAEVENILKFFSVKPRGILPVRTIIRDLGITSTLIKQSGVKRQLVVVIVGHARPRSAVRLLRILTRASAKTDTVFVSS